jgi:hypothetical protein
MVTGSLFFACATTRPSPTDDADIEDGVAELTRALPGDLAALYRVRVARSGGLRLAVVTAGGEGRMTISEPFGSAVSLAAWFEDGRSVAYDMEAGCRVDAADLRSVLGLRAMPLAQAARLLAGRLPTCAGDEIAALGDRKLRLRGAGWEAAATVEADPWRVAEIRELGVVSDGWRIELADHTRSVPGRVTVTNTDGRWAELELSRMEWPQRQVLPKLPDFPPCEGR